MPDANTTPPTIDRIAALAKLTGLPDLRVVHNDPIRLERLIVHCHTALKNLLPGTPLRYGIAYQQYAALATALYENPDDHEELFTSGC
jgi:hypothetical protein